MVGMAALVRLPARVVGAIGLAVIFLQQIFQVLPQVLPQSLRGAIGWIWEFVYPAGFERWDAVSILYVLVPWIGVMAAGYGFGLIVIREPAARRRLCLRIGLSATAVFLLAGWLSTAFGPSPGAEAFSFPPPRPAEISRVAAVPADDARPDDRPAAARRAGSRKNRGHAGDIRPGPDVLLPAAHSHDSHRRASRGVGSRASGPPGMVQRPRHSPPCHRIIDGASGSCTSYSLSSSLRVPRVPLVRPGEGAARERLESATFSPTVYGVWCGIGLNRDSLRLAQRGSQTPRRRGLKAPLHSEHM